MAKASNKDPRYPMHRGPFYFDPNHLANPTAWKKSTERLLFGLRTSLGDGTTINYGFGPWSIAVRFNRLELNIDARSGTLSIDEWSDDDCSNDNHWTGPIGDPRVFRDLLLRTKAPKHLEQEFRKTVLPASAAISNALLARFQQALRAGTAQIEGKPNSVMGSFQRVEPDEFRRFYRLHFKDRNNLFDDDEDLDEGDANGVSVFSISIVPTGVRVGTEASPPPTTPAAARKRFTRDRREIYDRYRTQIDAVIREGRKRAPQGKKLTVAFIQRYAEETLPDHKCPAKTRLREIINEIFPDL